MPSTTQFLLRLAMLFSLGYAAGSCFTGHFTAAAIAAVSAFLCLLIYRSSSS